jgi:hypothetical protein
MNASLGACPREGRDKLDGLKLKEAYALLREGEVDAAIYLVNSSRISPRLEKELVRFYDEAGLSNGKVAILEQRLSAKLEEISGDSPSIAEALCIFHQLLKAEFHSHKLDAAQSLLSLKAEHEALAKLGQQTSQAQDARLHSLEEQTKQREAECQETLASLRRDVKAKTAELKKANQTAAQAQLARDALMIQRSDESTQESLNSLREESKALYEGAATSGEKAMQIQSFIDQKALAQPGSQCVRGLFIQESDKLSKCSLDYADA